MLLYHLGLPVLLPVTVQTDWLLPGTSSSHLGSQETFLFFVFWDGQMISLEKRHLFELNFPSEMPRVQETGDFQEMIWDPEKVTLVVSRIHGLPFQVQQAS